MSRESRSSGHIIDKIIGEGITEATIVVGHMSDKIREYVAQAYPTFRADYVEQEERLGLGHAIYLARDTIGTEPVLIILGDTIFDVDLGRCCAGETPLGVKEVEDPRRFGVAEMRDGAITRLVEKPEQPASNLAMVGLYYLVNAPPPRRLPRELVTKDIRTKGEYQLTDALQMMLERGERMTTFIVEGWYDCGKPETLLSTNRALLEKTVRLPADTRRGDQRAGVHRAHGEAHATAWSDRTRTVGRPSARSADSVVRNSIIGEDAQVSASVPPRKFHRRQRLRRHRAATSASTSAAHRRSNSQFLASVHAHTRHHLCRITCLPRNRFPKGTRTRSAIRFPMPFSTPFWRRIRLPASPAKRS